MHDDIIINDDVITHSWHHGLSGCSSGDHRRLKVNNDRWALNTVHDRGVGCLLHSGLLISTLWYRRSVDSMHVTGASLNVYTVCDLVVVCSSHKYVHVCRLWAHPSCLHVTHDYRYHGSTNSPVWRITIRLHSYYGDGIDCHDRSNQYNTIPSNSAPQV